MNGWNLQKGFTIVELLIVVVVIAILAAITIVSFNGIQNRAYDSAVQADLRNFVNNARFLRETNAVTQYPGGTDASLAPLRFAFNRNAYDQNAGGVLYCVNVARTYFMIYGRSRSGTQFYHTVNGETGTTTTAFGSFGALCSTFTGTTNASDARYGISNGSWNSWTQ